MAPRKSWGSYGDSMRIWWERTTGVLVCGRQGLDVGDRVGVQANGRNARTRSGDARPHGRPERDDVPHVGFLRAFRRRVRPPRRAATVVACQAPPALHATALLLDSTS